MSLPIFQSDLKELGLLQTQWASQLNPVLQAPMSQVNILPSVRLKTGTNQVNHLLSRTLAGWFITRQRGAAQIYDNQDQNQMASLTLTLVSSADVVVDLAVF